MLALQKYSLSIFADLIKTCSTSNSREKIHDLLETCSKNRKQGVSINDTLSNIGVVNCDVPQGAARGPILFTTYLSFKMIPQNCINGKIGMILMK